MTTGAHSCDAEGMVGRGAEVAALQRLVADTTHAESAALAVVGEPGIGKTRLLAELRRRADAAGFLVLHGSGSEFEREVPFGLVVDALDEPFAALEPPVLRRIGHERLAELGAVLPSLEVAGGGHEVALDVERYRCHHAVRAALEQLSRARPILLVLDDVHWADPASVELVSHLLRRRVSRLLLAVAYRPRQASRQLLAALESGGRSGTMLSLSLAPLSLDESTVLLEGEFDAQRVELLHRESGGVPFYLEQLARAERRGAGAQWAGVLGDLAEGGEVPASVHTAIGEELDPLSADAQRLARAAAVAGEVFDVDLAAEIAGLGTTPAYRALDELTRAEVVRATEIPRHLMFRHPIVRRAIYDAESPGSLLVAHQRAAAALARRGATIGIQAQHVERSAAQGDAEALAVLTAAGRAAAARAPAAAARWFEAALRILPDDAAPEQRLALLLPLALALAAVGRLQDTLAVLASAQELCPPEGRRHVVALIARTEQALGRTEHARALLIEALAQAPPGGHDDAALRLELAENHLAVAESEAAAAEALIARDTASALGDGALVLHATTVLAWAANARGDTAEARALADDAAPRLDALGDHELGAYLGALFTMAYTEISLDRLPAADAHGDRGLRVARATGQSYWFLRFAALLAAARLMQGRLEEAREVADVATEGALLVDNDQLNAGAAGILCWVAAAQGQIDTALAAGRDALRAAARAPRALYPWLARVSYGEALLESGDHEGARDHILAAGGPELTDLQRDFRPRWHRMLTRAELAAGRIDAADGMAARAEAAAAVLDLDLRRGDALYARACVLAARGDRERAVAVARSAATHFDAAGQPIEVAHSRLLAGEVLVAAGLPDAAVGELEAAHGIYRSCGASRNADRTAQELRALGRRVARRSGAESSGAGSGPAALTDREREVAELVTQGHTNRQIAEQLFLSEKTIEKHLARVFVKLDVSTRSAVAAAIERWHAGRWLSDRS